MTNQDVADILDNIADILEILGESRFRILAYRKAANVIDTLPEDINDIDTADDLQKLPGIGTHIAERLEELLVTGRMKYFEELKEKVPPGLVELTKVRGLGPRTASLLYEKLGITNLAQLEKAVSEHKVRDVKGLGAKTEANILKNIKEKETFEERILLSESYEIVQDILEQLRSQPYVLMADAAGSLRRMRRTIGDIDLLVSSNEPEKVMDYFITIPQSIGVDAKGKTKSTITDISGRKVDIRVVPPESYGAALQYFTGSKEHSVHLREIAKQKGLKLNEYGVFDSETDKKLGGATEEDMYSRLDLPVIEPELREDHGEIEAAYEKRLPRLVKLEDIKGDLHAHTEKSDGLHTIEDMVAKAKELGYSYICISDHAQNLKVAGGLTVNELEKQIKRIDYLNKKEKDLRVLVGVELNIDNDGGVDYDEKMLKKLDFVAASIHSGFGQSKEQLTKRMITAIENPSVNMICHPTAEIINKRKPYALDLSAVFDAAAKNKTIMELNSFPSRLDLRAGYLRLAKKEGVKIAINTDAHNAKHLDYMFYGVAIARRGWLEKKDVVNTWPVEKLLKFVGKE